MKQTAVQELISEMEQLKETKLYTGSFKAIEDCLCLAYAKLEMEKEQELKKWIEIWSLGYNSGFDNCKKKYNQQQEQ